MHRDAVENPSHDSSVWCTCEWQPEMMRSSGTWIWQTSLTEPSKRDCLSSWIISTAHISCTQAGLHSGVPALALPMCQRTLQRRAVRTRDHEWNLCTAVTCVIQWDYTPRSTIKTHASHTWGLFVDSQRHTLHLTAHQSHSHVRGTGWDNSHAVQEKKGFLRDMYTLIRLVSWGTDWHPNALCPTQTCFVKLSWHSISEVCRSPIQHYNFLPNLHLSSVSQYIMNRYNGTTGG